MSTKTPDVDAVVVGAGFSGIRSLWELKRVGLTAKCFESGSDVGGVWYWNTYPGARTDSEGWVYSMNFTPELKELWDYEERYPSQASVQKYLGRVADKFDLRKQIQFNTKVVSAHYSDKDNVWVVTTSEGKTTTARFFFSATGPLSLAKKLPFSGLDSFKGEWYQTSNWPKEKPNLHGKRVALIGTGATGVQIVPKIAPLVKELVVVQRTANYVLPGRNYNIDSDEKTVIQENYDTTWKVAQHNEFGLAMYPTGKILEQIKDESEIRKTLDRAWESGGFHLQFETFDDVFTSKHTNKVVSDYLHEKIRAVVEDPVKAEILTPKHPFLSKRPPCGHFYYEAFNRPNVKLVDISKDEIDVYEKGIRTVKAGGEYEVDVIIFALGFDAGIGALCDIDIRGSKGQSIKEAWSKSVDTYAGVMVPGFTNFFVVCGPHIPFGNMPVVLDNAVQWVGKVLEHMEAKSYDKVTVAEDAAVSFGKDLDDAYNKTLFAESSKAAGAWFVGGNIPGRVLRPLFYFGGLSRWLSWLNKEVEGAWSSLAFSSS